MRYSNFDLRIESTPEGLQARVSVPHLGDAKSRSSLPFAQDELVHLLRMMKVPRREVDVQSLDAEDVARKIGLRLFEAVFSGDVLVFWRKSLDLVKKGKAGVRLRLVLRTPEISNWPWEYLFDPERGFLALSAETPVVRYVEVPIPPRPPANEGPLRVLAVAANPEGHVRLDVERELNALEKTLARLKIEGRVVFESLRSSSLPDLLRKLEEPFHVLHFIGHGACRAGQGKGMLIFEDGNGAEDRVTGNRLLNILWDSRSLGLVVLNSCESARSGETDLFTGVAQSLLAGGIPAVLAMQFPVTDRAAIAFSQFFYERLAEGSPVEEALARARKTMMAEGYENEWGTPVLYIRSQEGGIVLPPIPPPAPAWVILVVIFLLALAAGLAFWALKPSDLGRTPSQESRSAPPLEISTKGCPRSDLLGMAFVRIRQGKLRMGTKPRAKGERAHDVTISKPFCMGMFEVTWDQWRKVMTEEADTGPADGRLPVTGVSWNEVRGYLERVGRLEPGAGYRLATEAEWEYAARAGSRHRFSFGNDPSRLHLYGNCRNQRANDRHDGLAPVGFFQPNLWGLYDMHGNASEWVEDWYGPYEKEHQTDPKGPPAGTEKVRRGGSFEIVPENCDGVKRNKSEPGYKNDDVGFRLVRPVRL